MNAKMFFICALFFVLVSSNCLERRFVKGYSEVLEVRDSVLQDSSIITGFIFQVDGENYPDWKVADAEVKIENTLYKTLSDEFGEYLLKTTPGKYDLICKRKNERWPQLYEEIEGLTIKKNTVVKLDFYLGYTIE